MGDSRDRTIRTYGGMSACLSGDWLRTDPEIAYNQSIQEGAARLESILGIDKVYRAANG